jgi:hypothetical protein
LLVVAWRVWERVLEDAQIAETLMLLRVLVWLKTTHMLKMMLWLKAVMKIIPIVLTRREIEVARRPTLMKMILKVELLVWGMLGVLGKL